MANKYRKINFRFTKELIIIACVIVALVVATIILNAPTKADKFLSKWQNAGSSIQSNEIFEEVSQDSLKTKIDKKDGVVVVLFVSTEDSNSVTLFDEVNNHASLFEVDKVYVLDGSNYVGNREENQDVDNKLKEVEAKFGVTIGQVPSLWLYRNGELKATLNQDLVDEQSGSYEEALKRVLAYNLAE